MMVGQFAEVCTRRGLKVNAVKSKLMVLNGEEGLECEVHVDGIRLEHVSEFKYLECVLDESGTDGAECSRSLVNAKDLQLECARDLHEKLLVPILMYAVRQCYGKRRDLE